MISREMVEKLKNVKILNRCRGVDTFADGRSSKDVRLDA